MHCRNFQDRPYSRRDLLKGCGMGFGSVALQALLAEQSRAAISNPLAPKTPHFAPRAKNVIFLYMDGGPSHVDTFDYKPLLSKYNGQDPREVIGELAPTQFDNVGKVLQSQWEFKQRGESGNWVSDLFPHIARKEVIDEIAFVKSMTSKFSEHTFANYFLHTGSPFQGRPSMGAWTGYGLGSENENLPGFVVLNGGLIPPGGLDCFGSGFLPAAYQGSVFLPKSQPIANIHPREKTSEQQQEKLNLLRDLDVATLDARLPDPQVEAAIQNYETAFRMQTAVPDLMDLTGESDTVKKMYGLEADFKNTQTFGLQCLLARRLVQRGVRFIELTCPGGNGDRWDQHNKLVEGHNKNCQTVDQPIAALITDLKRLGMLESTLVVWAGEFGRTPFAQGGDGRDHNPFGFTVWMAGGGTKGGASVGETDEWGYKAVRDRYEIHDLHATMLHLLGVEHTKSTFRFSGRDMRLTDVHGHVMKEILA
ncbi:MAG: DUF1501 domain-containing protein [Verrucomicrobiales bacterium]|nr:DUF1501 domain-containing protein [Verrucomicrobiales bacterium]